MKKITNPWSAFWLSGAKASFLDDKSVLQNYQMRKFWIEQLAHHEVKQPIVDIGTGNGIAVRWLTDYANEKSMKLDIQGIDSAQIKPASDLNLQGETPYETFKLGGNKKVGAFISHYGFEYGDVDAGLANAYQQLKRGGQFIALMHSNDSLLVRNSEAFLAFLPTIKKQLKKSIAVLQDGLIRHGNQHLPKKALQVQDELNRFVNRFAKHPIFVASRFAPVTKQLLDLAAAGKTEASRQLFDQYYRSMTEHGLRMQQTLEAAKQVDDISALAKQLQALGFKNLAINPAEFPETGIVGRSLVALK